MWRSAAWGGLLLSFTVASMPAAAEPGWRLSDEDRAFDRATAGKRPLFAGTLVGPGAQLGVGMFDAGPKLKRQPSADDALDAPKRKRGPGIGLKLRF